MYAAMVIGSVASGIIWGKQKGHRAANPAGTGEVVMGALVERSVLVDLHTSITNLDGSVRELVALMEEDVRRRQVAAEVERELARRAGR